MRGPESSEFSQIDTPPPTSDSHTMSVWQLQIPSACWLEGSTTVGGDVQTGLFHRVKKLERTFQAEGQCLQSPRLGIRDEEAQG